MLELTIIPAASVTDRCNGCATFIAPVQRVASEHGTVLAV